MNFFLFIWKIEAAKYFLYSNFCTNIILLLRDCNSNMKFSNYMKIQIVKVRDTQLHKFGQIREEIKIVTFLIRYIYVDSTHGS